MTTKTETIRALNDELRQNLTVGTAFITAGIAALGTDAVARIVKTIAVYDDFCHANDPYEEHDFGSLETGTSCSSRSTTWTSRAATPPRYLRPLGDRARDHNHVGGRVLSGLNQKFKQHRATQLDRPPYGPSQSKP